MLKLFHNFLYVTRLNQRLSFLFILIPRMVSFSPRFFILKFEDIYLFFSIIPCRWVSMIKISSSCRHTIMCIWLCIWNKYIYRHNRVKLQTVQGFNKSIHFVFLSGHHEPFWSLQINILVEIIIYLGCLHIHLMDIQSFYEWDYYKKNNGTNPSNRSKVVDTLYLSFNK